MIVLCKFDVLRAFVCAVMDTLVIIVKLHKIERHRLVSEYRVVIVHPVHV